MTSFQVAAKKRHKLLASCSGSLSTSKLHEKNEGACYKTYHASDVVGGTDLMEPSQVCSTHYITCVISFTRLPHSSHATLKSWEGSGYEANKLHHHLLTVSMLASYVVVPCRQRSVLSISACCSPLLSSKLVSKDVSSCKEKV